MTLIALASGLIYLLVFTLPFPLHRFYNTIPPVDYTKLTNYSLTGLAFYVLGLAALFSLYIWAIRLTQQSPTANLQNATHHKSFILTTSTYLAAISLFAYPLTAIDLFIYAIRTRGWAFYGLNPLATAPELLPAQDPWLGLAAEWVDAPSPYGPLWEWLSLGGFYLSGGGFLAHLFALKLIAVLSYLGCVWLVYDMLRRIRPVWAMAGTIAFAWNPLVLLESVQNGHNDILMTLFFLAAVWAYVGMITLKNENPKYTLDSYPLWLVLICLFLALSILVKFVTVMTVPFFLIVIAATQPTWPRRIAVTGLSGLAIAFLVWLPLWPLWPGFENWAVLQAGSQAGRSLLALLVLALRGWLGTNPAFDLARNFILFIFALIYLTYLWQSVKIAFSSQPSTETNPAHPSLQSPSNPSILLPSNLQSLISNLLISPIYFPLFWYVLLAAPVFHAWYLLWFFPLASLLLPDRRALNAAVVFSITALLIIPYFETIRVWYPYLLQNHLLGHLIGVPLLIVPPAIAALGATHLQRIFTNKIAR